MSEEELEQDELDGADEDDGEELAAADDGEADSSDGDEAPPPARRRKPPWWKRSYPRSKPSRKSVTPSPRRWRNSFPAVERCRRSNPTWWPIRRRSRTASTAAAPSDFASSQGPPPVREWRALCYGALASSGSLAHPHAVPDVFQVRHGRRRANPISSSATTASATASSRWGRGGRRLGCAAAPGGQHRDRRIDPGYRRGRRAATDGTLVAGDRVRQEHRGAYWIPVKASYVQTAERITPGSVLAAMVILPDYR